MNPSDASPSRRITRSPKGCNAKPVYLALRPVERDEVAGIADRLSHSVGGTARLLMLIGLKQYRRNGLDAVLQANEDNYLTPPL